MVSLDKCVECSEHACVHCVFCNVWICKLHQIDHAGFFHCKKCKLITCDEMRWEHSNNCFYCGSKDAFVDLGYRVKMLATQNSESTVN